MPSADPAAGVEGQGPGGNRVVSFQNDPTVIEEGGGDGGDADDRSSSPPTPLHHSTRLKGYITLFVSALYNFLAANEKSKTLSGEGDDLSNFANNWCLYMDDLASFVEKPSFNPLKLNYAMACSMITVIITSVIIFCHLDFCTPLRKSVWPKVFGPHGKIELCILLFLTVFWFIATWFNTSINGPAGEGKDQYNLYFSSWICCWSCFWTLERWCTASGRASFERFVRSWPNRCPLWIVTFILSLGNFLFTLDVYRNWEEGTKFNPYVFKLYSEVPQAQWIFLFFVTSATFSVSLAWALAEIFRESRADVENMKSDVEMYVEGITAHILTAMWLVLVCIVTMPGGAASLLGNLYFTTWSTLFSVISTLVWYLRDWRQGIADVIREEEEKYELAKRSIRKREEKRLAKLAEEEEDRLEEKRSQTNMEESKVEEDDLCEDDPVDDDMTMSITSDYNRSRTGSSFSVTSSPDRPPRTPITGASSSVTFSPDMPPRTPIASSEKTPPADSVTTASGSLFMSAFAYFYPPDAAEDDKPKGDDN